MPSIVTTGTADTIARQHVSHGGQRQQQQKRAPRNAFPTLSFWKLTGKDFTVNYSGTFNGIVRRKLVSQAPTRDV